MRTASVFALLVLLWSSALMAGRQAGSVLVAAGDGFGVTGREIPALVTIGLFDVAANAVFALASQRGMLSISAVLASVYPVITALLARRLQAERMAGVHVGGVTCVMAGVALLAEG